MRRFNRALAAAQLPVLLPQIVAVRKEIPRLPEARGLREGLVPAPGTSASAIYSASAPEPLRLLVMGDSTALGVGAPSLDQALPGRIAEGLAEGIGRSVAWRAIGRSGADTPAVIARYLPLAIDREWDLIVLPLGTNDTMHLVSPWRHRKNLRTIIKQLRRRSPEAPILLSAQPAFRQFPSLPEPLRSRLAGLADELEADAGVIIGEFEHVLMTPRPDSYPGDFFASDGFHPSAAGYAAWAGRIVAQATPLLAER